MSQETTNLKLKTYDNVGDKEVHYIDYRTAQSGISNSNMTKIDDAYGELKQDIQNIDVSEQIETHNTSDTSHVDIRNLISNIDVSGQVDVGIGNHNANELSHPHLIQQLNEIATDLSSHKAENVSNGVHGLGSIATQIYETGVFTPKITGYSTAGNGIYPIQIGRYTRIGNRCFFNINISWEYHTGTGSGFYLIGLPFTSTNVVDNWVYQSSNKNATVIMRNNFSYIHVSGLAITASGDIMVSGDYEIK